MKKIFFGIFFIICITSTATFAQNIIYKNGNASLVQYPETWELLHGNTIVGHGNGTLDVNNLPPAFKSLLDYYAVKNISTKRTIVKKEKTAQYGPLLRTSWTPYSAFHQYCPTIDSKTSLAGCSSISSAEIMTYYMYCKDLNLTGTNYTSATNIKADYITNVIDAGDNIYGYKKQYDYNYKYTPDFEKLSNNNLDEVAKFLVGIALAQKADFGTDITNTFFTDKTNALEKTFGYKNEIHDITSLDDNNFISDNIKKGIPIIISGETTEEGIDKAHSFIIDGYNGTEYHINYGWGGTSNGWFSTTKYPNNCQIIITYPANYTPIEMKTPKYLCVKGEDVDLKIEMVSGNTDNILEYKQKDAVELPAGEYEFYFEYEDGTKIAPYTSETIQLNNANPTFSRYGRFVNTSAKLSLTDTYSLDFWHCANINVIKIEGKDFVATVSGKVTDSKLNALENAYVVNSTSMPEFTQDAINQDNSGLGFNINKAGELYTQPIKTKGSYISQIDLYLTYSGNPGNLNVAILNAQKKCLAQKVISSEDIIQNEWNSILFNEAVKVEADNTYYIALSAETVNTSNYFFYYSSSDNSMLYKIWCSNQYFAKTNNAGVYSFTADKYSSLKLNVFCNDLEFNTLTIEKITTPLVDKNFAAAPEWLTISGKVVDNKLKPIANVYISTSKNNPEYSVKCKNDVKIEQGYSVGNKESWSTCFFKLASKYISQIDLCLWKKGNPKQLSLEIIDIDDFGKSLYQQNIDGSQIVDKDWTQIKLNNLVTINPEHQIGIALYSNSSDASNCFYYYISADKAMVYRIYAGDEYYTRSDAEGKYTYDVKRHFAQNLYAFSQNYTFDPISFNDLLENSADNDFKDLTPHETYSITYKIDDEIYNKIDEVLPGTAITLIDKPTKEGYTFEGWNSEYTVMPEKDIYISGRWVKQTPTPVSSVNEENTRIWSYGKTIYVANNGSEIEIANIAGVIIKRVTPDNTYSEININKSGIYIVKTGTTTVKVVIR